MRRRRWRASDPSPADPAPEVQRTEDEERATDDDEYDDDDEDLDESQRLTKDIALYLTSMLEDFEEYRYHNYPANQMSGIQSAFPSFMDAQHQVNTLEDAENYLSRMSELPRKHEQYLLGLQIRESRDIIPPRFVIERILEEMRNFVATPGQENILYTGLAKKLEEAEEIDEDQAADVLQRAEASINDNVYPAYETFINYFGELEAKAGDDHGFWHLPDGDAAYRLSLRFFTTTSYTADEIHEIGLAEVERMFGYCFAASVTREPTMPLLASHPVADGETVEWGTGSFTFADCDSGTITLTPNATYVAAGFTELTYDITRDDFPVASGVSCPTFVNNAQ